MANLATYADVVSRSDSDTLIRLTDNDSSGEPDQARIEIALADATAVVYGKIGIKYPVPFAVGVVPPLLTSLCVSIALYLLAFRNRPDAPVAEEQQTQYETDLAMLDGIAAGDVSIGVDDPGGSGDSNPTTFCVATRVSTRSKMRSW